MASHLWMESWCRVEIAPDKYCNTCPRCECPHHFAKKETGMEIGWATPADLSPKTRVELRNLARKEWTPYRDPGEEG